MILPMLIGLNKINSISNTQAYNRGALMYISKNETMFPAGEWEMCLVSTIDKKIKPVPMTRRSGDINMMIGDDSSSQGWAVAARVVALSLLDIGVIWLSLYQIRDKDIRYILSGVSTGALYLFIVYLIAYLYSLI
tara:strand:+ start:6271 stop:6675 length:405 start_codon:yes stop_codon:yes gene_type:complete